MTHEEHDAIRSRQDPYQMAIRLERLDDLANSLVHATYMMLPRRVRRRFRGNVCIDATPVAAPAAPPRSNCGADLDGGWYMRTADWSDPNAPDASPGAKQKKVRKAIWGYEATLALATNNHFGSDQSEAPRDSWRLSCALGFARSACLVAGRFVGVA